jgi:hypothetical protein
MCKPIILLIATIGEAVLYDFHLRVQTFTSEGVKNVAKNVVDCIRGKRIDEFQKYIASAKKHELLEGRDSDIYETLEQLRKLRNRIHIQNTKGDFEPHDRDTFTMDRQRAAEKTLEKVIKVMATKYLRPEHNQGFVAGFRLPWDEHDPSTVAATAGIA